MAVAILTVCGAGLTSGVAAQARPYVHSAPARLVMPFRHAHATATAFAAFKQFAGFNAATEPSCCVDPPQISGAASATQVVQVDAVNLSVYSTHGTLLQQTALSGKVCGELGTGSQARIVFDSQT